MHGVGDYESQAALAGRPKDALRPSRCGLNPQGLVSARRSLSLWLITGAVLAAGLAFSSSALAAAPEEPVTEAATGVTATSATLNGELNPNASATAGYEFTYNTNGTCTEGSTTEPGADATGEGIKVSTPLTGLTPSTEYTFCAVATHTEEEVTETTSGAPLSFTTEAAQPAVVEESTSGVTPFAATLQALINPENQATTTCVFEFGPTEAYDSSVPCEPGTLEGAFEQSATAPAAELEPGTTYHYRVVVANATGTTEGEDATFTTLELEAPIVVTESVSGLSSTDASLEAQINPNFQETTYEFEYGTNEALTGATAVPGGTLAAASEPQLAGPADIGGGLTPGTTYFYRVVATNGTSTTDGPVEQFTTQATPALTIDPAQTITRTTAFLSGTVNPGGVTTSYYFAYIDQALYEAAVAEGAPNPYAQGGRTPEGNAGADHEVHTAGPLRAEELRPGTTYHYALVATNSVGTTIGPGATLTTLAPTPPIVATGAAVGVTQLAATITGSVDGRELSTIMQFEFGTAAGAGSLVPATVMSASGSAAAIEASFGNSLQPGTTYFYRVVATNADGTAFGDEQSFTTGVFSSPFSIPITPALLPFTSIAEINAKEAAENKKGGSKPLTRGQKLAKALRACSKKQKKRRPGCKRQARRKFGPKSKKT